MTIQFLSHTVQSISSHFNALLKIFNSIHQHPSYLHTLVTFNTSVTVQSRKYRRNSKWCLLHYILNFLYGWFLCAIRVNHAAAAAMIFSFSFCSISLFFWRQVPWKSLKEPLRTADTKYLQSICPSCQPTSRIRALKEGNHGTVQTNASGKLMCKHMH